MLVGFLARRVESQRKAGREILSIAILWTIGSPWILVGIFWAYCWAWIGHFKIEMNRPATFTYPLWSLFADFKMVSLMLSGKLWTGDPVASV
ncbi:MAG: Mpo1-like protein [Myxococcota bacterium]